MATIGQPINRVDGPLKVTGQATYTYEEWEAGQLLYGYIVGATIGKGRITRIDTARAEGSPGVRLVLTHQNAPKLGVKGLGELGICGAGAAVANAVFNATGVRVREFPITLEKVLAGLPLAQA